MKKITIKDIAAELNLDISTVSRALNDSKRVKIATKKLVNEYALKSGYHPNNMAVSLRNGKSNIIGVIVPRLERNFFAQAIAGIEEIAKKKGYQVMVSQSHEKFEIEQHNLQGFIKSRVEGILISVSLETKNSKNLEECNKIVPVIFFDRVVENTSTNKIKLNDYSGSYKAVEHLIKNGCQNIVHFGGPEHIGIYKDRRLGYLNALENNSIPINNKLIYVDALTRKKGFNVMDTILKEKIKIDGLFAASDYSALGGLQQLKERRVRVPEDVQIFGFGNEPFTSIITPTLSSVEQNGRTMGNDAAKLFFDALDNQHNREEYKELTIAPKLIFRESSYTN